MNDAIEAVRQQVEDLADRVGVFSAAALEAAMEKIETLHTRERALHEAICGWRRELGDLALTMNYLEPVEIAERLEQLEKVIFSAQQPCTKQLEKQLLIVQEDWYHLSFLYAFPDTEELNPDSFQNNLFFRLKTKNQGLLQALQRQCEAAEAIFSGKGSSLYQRLPEDVRKDVEGRLFERFPEAPLQEIPAEVLAAAVMASLSDRMMGA